MVHRIQEYKPKLKKPGSAVDTSDSKPALAYDSNSDIIMFSEESWFYILAGWLKSAMFFILSALAIFAVLYVTLAASLFFVTTVDDKPAFIARGTFLGGIPEPESYVLASPSEVESDNPLDRLRVAFLGLPDAQIVQIMSGPNDIVTASNGNVNVTGEVQGSWSGQMMNEKGEPVQFSNRQLKNEYVAVCVSGNCEPGSYLVVADASIFGEVKNATEVGP